METDPDRLPSPHPEPSRKAKAASSAAVPVFVTIAALGFGIYLGGALLHKPAPAPVAVAAPAVAAQAAPVPAPALLPVVKSQASQAGAPPVAPADFGEAPEPLQPQAQAPAAVSEPVYLNVGPRLSDEHADGDEVVFGCVFNTPLDNYPVLGDSIDVIVDGRRQTLPFKPSSVYPGGKYAAVHLLGAMSRHEVVFLPTYDLGDKGTAAVRIISRSSGLSGYSATYKTDFETLEMLGTPQRVRVK